MESIRQAASTTKTNFLSYITANLSCRVIAGPSSVSPRISALRPGKDASSAFLCFNLGILLCHSIVASTIPPNRRKRRSQILSEHLAYARSPATSDAADEGISRSMNLSRD
jgi:hypothetical protein